MQNVRSIFLSGVLVSALLGMSAIASADDYEETIKIFQNAGDSAAYFDSAYGYAVFPTIGKGGIGIGGARGSGMVYSQGTPIGNNDLLIASQARSLSAVLVTNNEREFVRVPDLTVENWV